MGDVYVMNYSDDMPFNHSHDSVLYSFLSLSRLINKPSVLPFKVLSVDILKGNTLVRPISVSP